MNRIERKRTLEFKNKEKDRMKPEVSEWTETFKPNKDQKKPKGTEWVKGELNEAVKSMNWTNKS